jgi:hypothetical protein
LVSGTTPFYHSQLLLNQKMRKKIRQNISQIKLTNKVYIRQKGIKIDMSLITVSMIAYVVTSSPWLNALDVWNFVDDLKGKMRGRAECT